MSFHQAFSSLLFSLTSAVIVSFIHCSFSLSDTYLVFRVWIFPSADLETYCIIPQSHQVNCNLYGMVLPLGIHFLGDWWQWLLSSCMTLVSLLWFWMVFEVWNGWGCHLILMILFLFLWWCFEFCSVMILSSVFWSQCVGNSTLFCRPKL